MSDPTAHHVGLTVSDLERSVAFYREVFGFEVLDRFEVSGDAFETVVDIDGASGRFAHLDVDGVRLELIEYDPGGERRSDVDLNQPGTSHFGLSVDSVDSFLEEVPDSVETVSEPQTTASGTRLVFLRDPDGNLIELLEA